MGRRLDALIVRTVPNVRQGREVELAFLWVAAATGSRSVRILIKQAAPEVVAEWKWRGVPVWSHAGMICTGETYKNVVKMTFAK